MGQIKVTKAPIEGLYIIEPTVHGDARGYFVETYNQRDMHEAGRLPLPSEEGEGHCRQDTRDCEEGGGIGDGP